MSGTNEYGKSGKYRLTINAQKCAAPIVIDGQVSGGWEALGVSQQPTFESDYVTRGTTLVGGPVVALRGVVRVRRAAVLVDASARFLKFSPIELGHADFALNEGNPGQWADRLKQLRQQGIFEGGIGIYKTFVHVDVRGTRADWDLR